MPSETEDRLDLGCIVGNLAATIVTKCGIVYQGTILDWDCGGFSQGRTDNCPPDSEDSKKEIFPTPRTEGDRCRSFIRMQLSCIPGNICCPFFVNTVTGSVTIGGTTTTFTATIPASPSRVTEILGTGTGATLDAPLYALNSSILINWDDVASIGSMGTTVCLTP
jgi:hypothetical protein